MATAKDTKERKKTAAKAKEEPAKPEGNGYLVPAVIIIAVIVIAVVLGYLASTYLMGGGSQQSLQGFENSFYSAPRVAIYVAYVNGSEFSYSTGCAYSLIERLIDNQAHHRNSSTIDFMIVANRTSCLSPKGSLGTANGTVITPLASCLAVSTHEPSIFINYSTAGNSTAIKSDVLTTTGDGLFLTECGISSEIG